MRSRVKLGLKVGIHEGIGSTWRVPSALVVILGSVLLASCQSGPEWPTIRVVNECPVAVGVLITGDFIGIDEPLPDGYTSHRIDPDGSADYQGLSYVGDKVSLYVGLDPSGSLPLVSTYALSDLAPDPGEPDTVRVLTLEGALCDPPDGESG